MTYCLVKRAICIWYINSESKQTARYALLLLENRGITTMDLKKDCQQVKFIFTSILFITYQYLQKATCTIITKHVTIQESRFSKISSS